MSARPKIYTLPNAYGFADMLAGGLLKQSKDTGTPLSQFRILLPTRRACRSLREAFLRQTNGQPLLLPLMHPLGDIDEDELTIKIPHADNFDVPPAIAPLRRRLLLARTIERIEAYQGNHAQALGLADALARFMDQILIEGLSLDHLESIVPDEFASHWQITIDFLKILSVHWPKILEENGVIEAAERRNILMNRLSEFWMQNPPDTPTIAAGSTGTVPASAQLMQTIASLPGGAVILPGLDRDIDRESWNHLDVAHPQFSLKEFLDRFELLPDAIKIWPYHDDETAARRQTLLREIMRPAETTKEWRHINTQKIRDDLQDLYYCETNTAHDEALYIALTLRETLETPGKTAALVTPDRSLAARVTSICDQWGITLDDSAGQSLNTTHRGSFLTACINAACEHLKPVALLSLLKHGLCQTGLDHEAFENHVTALDKDALRGNVAYKILNRLAEQSQKLEPSVKEWLKDLDHAFAPLLTGSKQAFSEFLKAHIELAETLATTDTESGHNRLWCEEDGEEAARLLSELSDVAHLIPTVTLHDYADIIKHLMNGITVRPSYGTHPRVSILGQMEARLIQTDVMILGGLNEGVWPPDVGHDPWMSRPMRKQYGLPSMDMRVGLSAHDFAQCFAARTVHITRAKRTDGAPTVPSRWIQRMKTVLEACTIDFDSLNHEFYSHLMNEIQKEPEHLTPCARPSPTPPTSARPQKLSVTAIETWMRDPYALYAKHILGLRKLDPLEEDMDAALRGSLIHAIFDDFITTYPETLPDNAADILMNAALSALGPKAEEPGFWGYWKPRFANLIGWFIQHEQDWRTQAKPLKTEEKGAYTLPELNFTLEAKADRIDRLNDGSAAIIDYKTGTIPPTTAVRAGLSPQLPLEALILSHNGFESTPDTTGYLGFWRMTGSKEAGEEQQVKPNKDETLMDLINEAEKGLSTLVKTYQDDNVPYYSLPQASRAPRAQFQDYAHLARVQEWSIQDDSEDAA